MVALRLRVLDSLAKRGSEAPSAMTQEDSDLEDGEVQEAVDTLIAKNSSTFPKANVSLHHTSAPSFWSESFGHSIPGKLDRPRSEFH